MIVGRWLRERLGETSRASACRLRRLEGLDRAEEVRETCRVALERALEAEGLWRREASAWAELARLAGREDALLARPLTDPFGSLPAPSTADLAPIPPALRR